MRSAPEWIDGRLAAAPVDRMLFRNLANAVLDRAPFARPHLPLLSRIARFLCVGAVGLAFDSGVFAILFAGDLGAPLARACSLAVATVVTWYLNRLFTFEASGRAPFAEMARYCGVATVAQGFNYAVFLSLHYAAGETRPFACLFVSAALAAVFSFTGQNLFAFARPSASARVDA